MYVCMRVSESLELGLLGICEPPCGCRELNQDPLEEQPPLRPRVTHCLGVWVCGADACGVSCSCRGCVCPHPLGPAVTLDPVSGCRQPLRPNSAALTLTCPDTWLLCKKPLQGSSILGSSPPSPPSCWDLSTGPLDKQPSTAPSLQPRVLLAALVAGARAQCMPGQCLGFLCCLRAGFWGACVPCGLCNGKVNPRAPA